MSQFLLLKHPELKTRRKSPGGKNLSLVSLKLKKNDISQLVFSGGGVRGIAYSGVFRSLSEQGILPNIKKVCGTSAGSIAALLLALNYAPEELENMLRDIDLTIFQDQPFFGSVGAFYDLGKYMGFYSGNNLFSYIVRVISDRIGLDGTKLTLGEFDIYSRAKEGSDGWIYRQFCCIGTHKNTGMEKVLSAETYPDMPLVIAIRISCSIPFYYQPVKWPLIEPLDSSDEVKVVSFSFEGMMDSEPLIDPLDFFDKTKNSSSLTGRAIVPSNPESIQQYWEDGGIVDNYDLSIWDTQIEDGEDISYIPNMHTLGFRLFSPSDERDSTFHYRQFPINNLYDSIVAFINTMLDQADRLGIREEFWERTISIPTGSIIATQFDLSDDDKNFLDQSGYEATKRFLNSLE